MSKAEEMYLGAVVCSPLSSSSVMNWWFCSTAVTSLYLHHCYSFPNEKQNIKELALKHIGKYDL